MKKKKPVKKSNAPAVTKTLAPNTRILPPPPPPKKQPPPPPPPPLQRTGVTPDFKVVVAAERAALPKVQHREPIAGATHLEFTSADGKTVVVAPVKAFGDFSSAKGTVRYGRLVGPDTFRYAEGEAPENHADPTDHDVRVPGTPPPPPKPKTPRAPGSGKREGVCGFIDATIMEGGRTAEEVLAIVLEKFPGRDPKATLSTIRCRPSHIRKAGNQPPPFKK